MTTLVFATGNPHKLKEVRSMMPAAIKVNSLADLGMHEELPETQDTIEGNAVQKANFIFHQKRLNCFAEDTGLEVDVLDGAPGVHSARYAGPGKDARANMEKLLQQMDGISDRGAQFKTVIALILSGTLHRFEDIVRGEITEEPRGTGGFGYDPVFCPVGYDRTFGELGETVKNNMSHRAIALKKMTGFFNEASIQP